MDKILTLHYRVKLYRNKLTHTIDAFQFCLNGAFSHPAKFYNVYLVKSIDRYSIGRAIPIPIELRWNYYLNHYVDFAMVASVVNSPILNASFIVMQHLNV